MSSVTENFRNRWRTYYAPSMIHSKQATVRVRNLQVRDVVVVTESYSLCQGYFIGRVKNVYPSKDGIVRRVDICYRNFRVSKKIHQYNGSTEIVVSREVKNLFLLVGMDEL